jgi:heparan-alpha-glucosaminide N-acetyltransferase
LKIVHFIVFLSNQPQAMKYNTLSTQRILSIDLFRGITILTMIFVNDVAGVGGIPGWMEHAAADADAMTFVDIVFPAFLFIVGMSIPFALNNRLAKGHSFWNLQRHIAWRTIGLLVLGVFMVNAEGGYNEAAMGMPIHLWSLLFYACVILVWNVYPFKNKLLIYGLQTLGAAGLLWLGFAYRGGENGTEGLTPQWWGILGLIGWAYLFSCIIYQLVRGSILWLLFLVAACVVWFMAGHIAIEGHNPFMEFVAGQSGNASHTSIVLSGIIVSLLFFNKGNAKTRTQRFMQVFMFAVIAAIVAFLLRPWYGISKIYATPSWCLFSVAICTVLFCLLYWLTDIKQYNRWTVFFKPAAANPLLVYILPVIIYHVQSLFSLYFMPDAFHQGWTGIAWSACYALIIMALAIGLNKLKIRLHL